MIYKGAKSMKSIFSTEQVKEKVGDKSCFTGKRGQASFIGGSSYIKTCTRTN